MRQRFLLLHNAVAGLRRHRLVRQVVAELKKHGGEIVTLRLSGLGKNLSQEALARIVHHDGFDAVIAAGGDGTIRALAKALGPDGPVPVGVIPVGTGNVLARELGLPYKAAEVADMLLNGPEVNIPGATAGTEPFYLMAGAGFDGEIISNLNLEVKRRIGKPAYVWPTLKALSRKPKVFDVVIDGKAYEATWIVATKASRYAGGFTLVNGLSVRDEKMIAVLFQASSRCRRLVEMAALGLGALERLPGVEVHPCEIIEIQAEGLPVQIDGDETNASPVTIKAGNGPLRLIVPSDAQSESGGGAG
ncbi:MAG: diacylglycerol kinase family protein [Filomicrobium sp.]